MLLKLFKKEIKSFIDFQEELNTIFDAAINEIIRDI